MNLTLKDKQARKLIDEQAIQIQDLKNRVSVLEDLLKYKPKETALERLICWPFVEHDEFPKADDEFLKADDVREQFDLIYKHLGVKLERTKNKEAVSLLNPIKKTREAKK